MMDQASKIKISFLFCTPFYALPLLSKAGPTKPQRVQEMVAAVAMFPYPAEWKSSSAERETVIESAKRIWKERGASVSNPTPGSPVEAAPALAETSTSAASDDEGESWQARMLRRIDDRVAQEELERANSDDGKLALKFLSEMPPPQYSDNVRGEQGSWQRKFLTDTGRDKYGSRW